jgi:hypothetical protein
VRRLSTEVRFTAEARIMEIPTRPSCKMELWITGTVDPLARGVLEKKGWKIEDKIQDRLLKKLEP